jgi:hypothetical protein
MFAFFPPIPPNARKLQKPSVSGKARGRVKGPRDISAKSVTPTDLHV